jgi:hypothetical protein
LWANSGSGGVGVWLFALREEVLATPVLVIVNKFTS